MLNSLKLEDTISLAKPWISWRQINTDEEHDARLGILWCFTGYLIT